MGITYSAHEAKARFAEMLRHVREGETVTVSYRGEPVAEVRPLTERVGTPGPQGSAADRSETVVGQLVRELENRDPGKTPEQRLQDAIRRWESWFHPANRTGRSSQSPGYREHWHGFWLSGTDGYCIR